MKDVLPSFFLPCANTLTQLTEGLIQVGTVTEGLIQVGTEKFTGLIETGADNIGIDNLWNSFNNMIENNIDNKQTDLELSKNNKKSMGEAPKSEEDTTAPSPQTFDKSPSPGASSSARSSSGASEVASNSVGSYSSNNSAGSGASNSSVGSLVETLRKLVGGLNNRNDPTTGKGLESQEDQKGPTKSPPNFTAGIKKAISSCCSYLSNGFKSMFETDVGRLIQEQRRMQSEIRREEKRQRKEEESERKRNGGSVRRPSQTKKTSTNTKNLKKQGVGLFSSLRGMMSRSKSQNTSSIGNSPNEGLTVHFTEFRKGSNNGKWVSRDAGSITLPTVNNIGSALYNGGKSGVRSLAKGVASVGRNTLGVAEFMATPGESSGKTWEEWVKEQVDSTRGMRSDGGGYGVGAAAMDAGAFAYQALKETPKAVREAMPGERAANFVGSIARRGVNIVSNARDNMTIIVPTSLTR